MSDYLPGFSPIRGDKARMLAALDESRNDLQTLIPHLQARITEMDGDEHLATSEFVQGLIDSPVWDRMMLASVLGVAVAQLAAFAAADQDVHHIVDLRESGWTLKHPLSCRLGDLFNCPVNRAAERDLLESPPWRGQYLCYIDDEGFLAIGDEVPAEAMS